METVGFIHMADGTAEDYALLDRVQEPFVAALPDRLLEALDGLKTSLAGYQVSRYEHSLQSATRAHRDGRSEEYVVAALLHDIGDELAPYTHGEMVAAVLRPYIAPEICWIVKHHGLFQMYYYAHHSRAATATPATATATTPGTTPAPSSASSTTRAASTRPTTRCRSRRSSRWCGGCSPSRATWTTRRCRDRSVSGRC